MNSNPFKFGTLVGDPYFTDREQEISRVKSVLDSANHLIIIGPRRYGKTSLVYKATESIGRPVLFIDMQLVNTPAELASSLIKRIYKSYPAQRVKSKIRNFRIIPSLSLNPVTNEIDVRFNPWSQGNVVELEDSLNLVDQMGRSGRKPVVVFDEFQEIFRIDKDLARQLRSIMQSHQYCSYVFLGSQESMIREIFERKKSPFYHFGLVLSLDKIPEKDFMNYLSSRLEPVTRQAEAIAGRILELTGSHPYYTQQLGFYVWEVLQKDPTQPSPVDEALKNLVQGQDLTYERLWSTLNTTDRKLLIGLVKTNAQPLSAEFLQHAGVMPVSTIFSSLKRLVKDGYLLKSGSTYLIDDVFFKIWLKRKLALGR